MTDLSPAQIVHRITEAMRAAIPTDQPALINNYYEVMEYHLGWRNERLEIAPSDPGKLVRPMLAILACQALGGSLEHALPLAGAVQLLHDFSLIHDDIEDHSLQRRGRATLWSIWGMEVGINAGDGMFALAHRSLHRLPDVGVDPVTSLAVLRGFVEVCLRLCEGQHLDITAEGRFDVTTERYIQMIRGKTAALISASAGLGARIATADAAQVAALRTFGEAVGITFQVQDDILDIWGNSALTGKPQAADLIQRKLSLPVIYALEHASAEDRATFERLYRQPESDGSEIPTLLAILERTGAQAATEAMADHYHAQAEAALATVKPANPAALQQLRQLAEGLLRRKH